MQAAQMFTAGVAAAQVAAMLEVSEKSAYAWRRAWRDGGCEALCSKGPSGQVSRLDERQLARLEQILDAGAAQAGFADQRWTLARVAKVIARRFHVRYSLKGVSLLLHRRGWTVQVPKHRASERDEAAIARWRRYRWPAVKGSRAGWARRSFSPMKQDRR
jgi:transposase